VSQAPKPPNPFDPVEQAQIAQMVNEGGKDFEESVNTALESFRRLDEGGAASSVTVHIDGNHTSASWAKPPKK